MPDKVLVYSRFPKAQLIRFGERYELLNAAGKRLDEAFPVAELADVSAMITAGGRAPARTSTPFLRASTPSRSTRRRARSARSTASTSAARGRAKA